jgi:hypothetical protein
MRRDNWVSLAIGITGSLIAAVLTEFLRPPAMEHIVNILKSLAPVWAGLAVFSIVRAVLFLYRLQTRHDAVFAEWFSGHDRNISTVIEMKFGRMESEIASYKRSAETELRAIRDNNDNAIRHFHVTFERRLSAVEEIVGRDR